MASSSSSSLDAIGERDGGSKGFINLILNRANINNPNNITCGPWFDSGRQKMLYARDNAFYWFDPFAGMQVPANTLAYECSETWPLSSLTPILTAKISLDNQLMVLQKSSTELVVLALDDTEEKWNLTIKHSEDNRIISPGVVWSEHGGKSQDLVILTGRGLELYKVAPLKGQCKLSRGMSQRSTRYLYDPTHRVVVLTAPRKYAKSSLEVHAFFLRFDAFTDMPRLELPPPDKMPMISFPESKDEDIFLAPIYSSLYLILHAYGSSGSDDLILYMMTKTGAMRTHNLTIPVSGGVRVTSTDNLLYCHCIESRISLAFDIFASSTTNQAGIVLDSPVCGASMLRDSDASLADQPYSGQWTFLYPSYFWDSHKKSIWIVSADLKAIHDSMHDPRRLIPFLARRGQIMLQYRAKEASGLSGSYIASVGAHAMALIIDKLYVSIIEKVGLPFLQGILESAIGPYANELIRLRRMQEEESVNRQTNAKQSTPKIVFKGAKVRYTHTVESPTMEEIKSEANSLENCWEVESIVKNDDFLPKRFYACESTALSSVSGTMSEMTGNVRIVPQNPHRKSMAEFVCFEEGSTMRRDPFGYLVIPQSDFIRQIWIPLAKDPALDINYYIWALQMYIASLIAVGVVPESSITTIFVRVLCRQCKYAQVIQILDTKFLPDSVMLSQELLQNSEIRKTEIEVNRVSLNSDVAALRNFGIEMLWRLGEQVQVVRWLLKNSYINEALTLSSRSDERDKWGSAVEYLNADSISGLEFFNAALRACENNMRNGKSGDTDKLFEKLHCFLSNWDSSLSNSPVGSNNKSPSDGKLKPSMLSKKCQFPDHFFSTEEQLTHFNTKFGFSQRSIST